VLDEARPNSISIKMVQFQLKFIGTKEPTVEACELIEQENRCSGGSLGSTSTRRYE
jgi:hypothetical protein